MEYPDPEIIARYHRLGTMTLADYHAEITRLAVECKLIAHGEQMYDAEAWRDMFEDELTPAEALENEMVAMAEICQ